MKEVAFEFNKLGKNLKETKDTLSGLLFSRCYSVAVRLSNCIPLQQWRVHNTEVTLEILHSPNRT